MIITASRSIISTEPDSVRINKKYYNFLDCDWFKKLLFSNNFLAKLFSDSLLLEGLLWDSQSLSKL